LDSLLAVGALLDVPLHIGLGFTVDIGQERLLIRFW
jgi:hypothetical protein